MSRVLTTTMTYGVLGLLAVRPYSTYELAKAMGLSVGRAWPRAESVAMGERFAEGEGRYEEHLVITGVTVGSAETLHVALRRLEVLSRLVDLGERDVA